MVNNVLSLFDGISCGQIALNRAGIKYDKYFASEIDKNSILVTQDNFPDTIQIGDVTKIDSGLLPKIDLLMGGSPCQGFSFAGKQLNFEDPRSKLFFEYVRLKNELSPEYFLLENVRMKKSSQDIISKYMGCEPVEINSNLVSAQNRRRLYWTNIPFDIPDDRNVKLKDVLEDNNTSIFTYSEKGHRLTGTEPTSNKVVLEAKNKKKVHIDLDMQAPFSFYETRTEEGKEARRKIRKETGRDSTPRSKEYKMYLPLTDNKANCLVTVRSPLDYIVDTNWNYRILSRLEMERLQTVPDNYTKVVSDAKAGHMLGNGWTVDIIANFLKNIKGE